MNLELKSWYIQVNEDYGFLFEKYKIAKFTLTKNLSSRRVRTVQAVFKDAEFKSALDDFVRYHKTRPQDEWDLMEMFKIKSCDDYKLLKEKASILRERYKLVFGKMWSDEETTT